MTDPLHDAPLDLSRVSNELRARVVRMSHEAGCPHLGSALSCMDLLTVLYGHAARVTPATADDPSRDRVVLSKGHAAPALYAVLERFGFIDPAVLERFNTDGAELAEQPSPGCVPGIEAATGSLGHGLPIAAGLALGAKIQKTGARVYAVLSDGECNEGSTWEAAMTASASAFGLHNLCVLVDYNKWQATGRSDDVLHLQDLAAKWAAFGWQTQTLDGHDVPGLIAALDRFAAAEPGDAPTAFVCHTVKGRGVSFMEDDNNWHYRIPTVDEVEAATVELLEEVASDA